MKEKKNNIIIERKVIPLGAISWRKILENKIYIISNVDERTVIKENRLKTLIGLLIVDISPLIACVYRLK